MKVGLKGTVSAGLIKEVWCVGRRVREVWAQGEQYFSDDLSKIRRFTLSDPEEMEYWVHVVSALENKRSKTLVTMNVNGRLFHLVQGDGTIPVLGYDDGWWVVPDGIELNYEELKSNEILVAASVPLTKVEFPVINTIFNPGSTVVRVLEPIITGTGCQFIGSPNYSGYSSYFTISFQELQSDEVFMRDFRFTGTVQDVFDPPVTREKCMVEVKMIEGKTTLLHGNIVFPAFEKVFSMRLKDIGTR